MSRKLVYGIIAIGVVLIVALIVFGKEEGMYSQPASAVFTEGQADSLLIKPATLKNLLNSGNYLVIDMRKPEYFLTETLEGAINIPAGELLSEDNEEKLEEAMEAGKKIVVFADNSQDALVPWLILRQKGFSNVYLLLGGFDGWKKYLTDNQYNPSPIETSSIDYPAEIQRLKASAGGPVQEEKPKEKPKITPKPVEHHGAAEGGC
ncbi:MAG: rhodanese-like domain-containing protein [Bacteroidales bacterium]